MPYALRTFKCLDCGQPTSRRLPAKAVTRCPVCAIQASAENARQLHAKSGPYYQRWQWAFATAVRRMATEAPRKGVGRAA